MSQISIGDLAQSLQLRRDNARLSERINTLTAELTTGRTTRPDQRLGGNYTILAALEADLSRTASVSRALDEFSLETDARQQALSAILDLARGATPSILQASGGLGPEARRSASQTAEVRFETIIANLNTQLGGRSLFAGQDVNGPALADADVILTAIDDAIAAAGATTPADVATVIDTWFGPGGDYETTAYLGSADALSGPNGAGRFDQDVPTALDPRIREMLAGLAMASTIARSVFDAGDQAATDILGLSGDRLLTADQRFVDLRAEIGTVQDLNEQSLVELASRNDALEQARAGLTEIDPFEVATELQATEAQLQALYTLTARLSNLSLTEFIR